ncbi:molybdopterin molybdotransferase MoeA [Miniphocaeibacter halophilus]|uniref:Molybdopterin molybdotransferase MoeA n=1 Tax=Miniphocaeibacter halophilus TaxID=2931922 RepID=A0AC61MTF0_9FIRM|nr:molybdopterin molybdotransferase MoeA [Miniphocaeibacter halophilus]QQK08980.1 molybdopterin molybdotransferase MoeA [Miniphocaeibacter halophilus]
MNLENLPKIDEVLSSLYSRLKLQRKVEYIPLNQAANRVLAEDMLSKNTLPVVRSSKLDGVAVNFSDFQENYPERKIWEKDIDYCLADTGDDFNPKFDTVIPIENITFLKDGNIKLSPDFILNKYSGVNKSGSHLKSQELLIKKDTLLNFFHLNLMASGGYNALPVYEKPIVTYIPTGNELIYPSISPSRGENIESNGIMVRNLIEQWGARLITYPICKDIRANLNSILDEALFFSDIVLINGGSSKGSEDFNTKIIEDKSSFFQHRVKVAPGFPIGIGIIDNKPVINLPGPPIATFAAMHWCVKNLINYYLKVNNPLKNIAYGELATDLKTPEKIDLYLLLRIDILQNKLVVRPFSNKERHAEKMHLCNAITRVPAGSNLRKGDSIKFEWI